MHQERDYPGRAIATELVNPDFVALARAFGAHGDLVMRTAEFLPAFDRAVAAGKPALIELRTDPQQITTRSTLATTDRARASARIRLLHGASGTMAATCRACRPPVAGRLRCGGRGSSGRGA